MATFTSYPQGTPSWIEHSSADQEAAKRFYGDLFGWSFDDRPMGEPGAGTYSVAHYDGEPIAGLGPIMAPSQPASWGVYLATDDVDEATRVAQEHGGTLLAGPFDVGEAGRMAWVADPQGAAVGLWQTGAQGTAVRANEPGTNVESADATADRVRELGGQVVSEPSDIPGVGRMAVFTDPTGAWFNVMQSPDEES